MRQKEIRSMGRKGRNELQKKIGFETVNTLWTSSKVFNGT